MLNLEKLLSVNFVRYNYCTCLLQSEMHLYRVCDRNREFDSAIYNIKRFFGIISVAPRTPSVQFFYFMCLLTSTTRKDLIEGYHIGLFGLISVVLPY